MFGKLGEAFSSVVDKAKGAFSFGKSPEVSKTVLPPEVDARLEIHDSVARVMDGDKALENWANGDGWKSDKAAVAETRTPGRLDNVVFQASENPMDRMDLSVFRNQAISKDETSGRLDNVIFPDEVKPNLRMDLRAFAKQSSSNDETPAAIGADVAAFEETGKFAPLRADAYKAERLQFSTNPNENKGHGAFGLQFKGMELKPDVDGPEYYDASLNSGDRGFWDAKDFDVRSPQTNVVPLRPRLTPEKVRQMEPQMYPGETFSSRATPGAFRMRIAAAVAVLMATVGGAAHAKSIGFGHKPERSYSVDDIVPMNNEQAKNAEAFRAAERQKANQDVRKVHNFDEIARK